MSYAALFAELNKIASLIRSDWGIKQVESMYGVHGVYYVDAADSEENEAYAIVGFVLPEGIYVEIEDGTYGEVQGFRIYREEVK